MNSPLLNFQPAGSDLSSQKRSHVAKVFPFKAAANEWDGGSLPVASSALVLGHPQNGAGQKDGKLLDYLILGALVLLAHAAVVDHFQGAQFGQEIIEPAKVPPKVEITLVKPQPKPVIQPPPPPPPPPKVQAPPKPPVPKAVPLKPKPKVKPKVVEKQMVQPLIQPPAPFVESKAPVTPAPPVVQKAPVEEKVTEPRAGASYLHNPSPEYPEVAMDRGWEGKVLMKVHVQPNGQPDTINVIKSSGHSVLDDAAVRTVKQWSFVPAMRGKTPIAGWVTVPIAFNLQN
ncbi:energy transducer TonB [Methylovulum miyakonense]|uniref:energy transducer TonB n=1 Tax=Methylovulum miyakonense TaxID=645578 RepID=UPI00035F85AC|nr:energy transducer TonB [Methylovulum miyakonense]